MILAGDIGGTKTLLALYQADKATLRCIKKATFKSADFASFDQLLAHFLAHSNPPAISSVCLGVAGPVIDANCSTTNLPWVLTSAQIARQTRAFNVRLLNDLEATAWGVLDLPVSDFVELNPQAQSSTGNMAVLAAGTGLGEALIIWSDNQHHVVATEGGHSDFAPRNALEIGLLRYLLKLYPEHVSYERVLCGQGLVNIYHYLRSIDFAPADPDLETQLQRADPAVVIAEQAALRRLGLSAKALQLFCAIYGAETGNLALKCLPSGGIILAGGIASKNVSALQHGDFLSAYLAKGRYATTIGSFSIKLCLNPQAALIGAANFALNKAQTLPTSGYSGTSRNPL